jgi:hypothetical protein
MKLYVPVLLSVILLLSGCLTYGLVRKEWRVQPSLSGASPSKAEFLELANEINKHLGLIMRERWTDGRGNPSPLLFTDKAEESKVPNWMMVSYGTEDIMNVLVTFYPAKNKPKNRPIIESIMAQIDEIIREFYGGRYPVKEEYDDNFRMPADII